MKLPYFFSQPDGEGEPTIWLERDPSANALPMLRRLDIGAGRGPIFEDRERLWALIEHAISPSEIAEADPGIRRATQEHGLAAHRPLTRGEALGEAEAFIQSGAFLTRPLDGRGVPMPEFRALTAREHLDLVLETARFLLGENA